MKLYDLAAADAEVRFSPYCWRTRMALRHKGLEAETIPWRFTDKEAIAFSGQDKVPVLTDGDKAVADSWAIATYLEDAYPDRPSLFGGPTGLALSRFINTWTDVVLIAGLFPVIILDIEPRIDEKDRDYFRRSREARFKMTLEDYAGDRDERLDAFRKSLLPLRLTLKTQPYLGGEAPCYADYIAFGPFQWARCMSPVALLEGDDPVARWRDRLLDAFDGYARRAKTAAAPAT